MKKITLVCLILMVVTLFFGCGKGTPSEQENPSEQAKLTRVDNGLDVQACGDHSIKVVATLLVDAKGSVHDGQFEAHAECTLQPGESKVLTYTNPYCTVIDVLDYDITVIPKEMKFDLDTIFWIVFVISIIIFFIIAIIDGDASAGAFVIMCAILTTFFVVLLSRIILGEVISGPVDFYLFGFPYFF